MFVDEAVIWCQGGPGGNGVVAMLRERGRPRGGPAGGNGGRGGHVVLAASADVRTLVDCQYQRHLRGGAGGHGSGSRKQGARGEDCVVRVPVGTVAWDADTGELLGDLRSEGDRLVVARGGRGGYGNAHFAGSQRRAPRFAEKGEPGQSRNVRLELKLLADVGLVGFPNAGKSTLLSRISAARPRIADYPFTTLTPNLGTVRLGLGESFVVADVPGLIEGAHAGQGLGHRFLRHIERTRVLVYLVDVSGVEGRHPQDDLRVLRHELSRHRPELMELASLIVANKMDLPGAKNNLDRWLSSSAAPDQRVIPISAATGENVDTLVGAMAELLQSAPSLPPARPESPSRPQRSRLTVHRVSPGRFELEGEVVERLLQRIDLENEEAVMHMQKVLERMGVPDLLREHGVQPGDMVVIAGEELSFVED